METLILFTATITVIWTPHVVAGIITRARYWVRSHYGYTPKSTGVNS